MHTANPSNGRGVLSLLKTRGVTPGKFVVQMSRDGRELVRAALPATLPPATAFYVSEASRIAYTVHGSKIVATSLDR